LTALIDITIIIVTYNHETEISACLKSLKHNLMRFHAQLIIIDNFSRDQTVRKIRQALQPLFKDHEFLLIQNSKNEGFTKAVNQGLRQSKGKYILLLNPDTVILDDVLPVLIEQLKKNDNFGIIAPQFLNSDGSIQPSCRRFPKHRDLLYTSLGLATIFKKSPQFNHWKMGDFDHNSARFVDQPQGAFLLTQQKAVQQVGLLDELFPMFFSDVDWCRRFTEKGWKIFFYPNVQIVHHKGTSIYKNRLKMIWSSHQSFYRYFKKYYPGCRWRLVNFFTKIYLMSLAIIRSLVYLTVKNKFK